MSQPSAQAPDSHPNPQPVLAEPAIVLDTPPHDADDAQLVGLFLAVRRGANWFYWIAALSLINSVILLMGGNIHFVIGLGVTMIVDAVAAGVAANEPSLEIGVKVAAFVMDLVIAGVVILFGWLANKRITAIYALGMVLYLLDGLLFMLVQDWMSFGFHVFALYCMWGGFVAVRQLNRVERGFQFSPAG